MAIQPRLWGDLPDAPVAPWSPPAGVMRPVEWRAMDEFGAVLAWDALAQWASEPNPFYESWYLLPALRGMAGDRVRILRYEVDGELAGLLPVHRSMRYYGHPVPHVANWLHPNGFIGAPLVARGMERGFWRALLGWADRQLGLFLHLGEMPMTGALVEALRHVLGEQGRVSALVAQRNHVMLQSDMSAQDYFEASVSGKKRKEYRRQASRLGELGEVAFVRQRGGQGLAQWAEDFLALEAAGWKGEARSALACAPATAALWRESLAGAAARGRLERLAMTLDGRPVAMLATFLAPPAGFMFKTAFDESLAAYSPGVLLQRENMAMLGAKDIAWVDACAGEDHPMISHLWRERRPVGRVSIALGGAARRAVFGALARRELGGRPFGI